MSGTVGGVSCDFLRGTIGVLQERVLVYTVPGLDGVGRQNTGNNAGAEFTLTAEEFGTRAQIDTWYASLKALVGQAARITITNDLGQTSAHCSLVDVGALQVTPAVNNTITGDKKGAAVLSCVVEA